jgi:hypothetical protein
MATPHLMTSLFESIASTMGGGGGGVTNNIILSEEQNDLAHVGATEDEMYSYFYTASVAEDWRLRFTYTVTAAVAVTVSFYAGPVGGAAAQISTQTFGPEAGTFFTATTLMPANAPDNYRIYATMTDTGTIEGLTLKQTITPI